MQLLGNLSKLKTNLTTPISYQLTLTDTPLLLNPTLGQKIQIRYTGLIHCTRCNRKTNKSFQQGYCFPCYRQLADCNYCLIHPERCKYHEGSCDADHWVHANCGQPHIIYLANSSQLKVGITRETQIPTRWIDQGAIQAIPIIKVKNRYHAGLIEVALKSFIADKTDWRAMLRSENAKIDLIAHRKEVLELAAQAIQKATQNWPTDEIELLSSAEAITLNYPVLEYPQKIKSLDLEKTPIIEGTLLGIKGQYLILDIGVINIRKFTGYQVEFKIN